MDTPPSDKGDLYIAINKCIDVLKDISILIKNQRAFHLKLLVHFVGDLHQPLHLGQEIDRGANRISVKWFGSNTNLHSVWDSRMIDSYKMSYSEMAYTLQKMHENRSKKFQKENLIKWIDQIHDGLAVVRLQEIYKSLDDSNLGYEYQYKNFDTVKNMLSLGGYRLARILDYIFI